MLVATVHSEQDLDEVSLQTFFFIMSASGFSAEQRLSQPSTKVARSDSDDRLGGLDDLLDQAMDLSTDPGKSNVKTDHDVSIEEDTNKLLDFDDFLITSKSRVKPDPSNLTTEDLPFETVEELVDDEPVLLPSKPSGTSSVSPALSTSDYGNKKYKLFVCPEAMECDKLCKTFIGQGTTVCMNLDCLKNHRQKRIISVDENQLFVSKSKDIVFAEPTLSEPINFEVLLEWKSLSLTIGQWREKFEIVRKTVKEGTSIKPDEFKDEEFKMESAKNYKTPSKRRVRESLDEDELEHYDTLEVEDSLNWDRVKEYFDKIDKALQVNSFEHQKFRSCQIEIEDNFREISYASEFNTGLLNRKIGKRPKIMDDKFDGPDLYSVVGAVAGEVMDLNDEVKKKVDQTIFSRELKNQQLDTSNKMIKDFTNFKMDMERDFKAELIRVKADYESQIKQVRSGWIGAFSNMKNAFRGVFSDLRTSIDQLEIDTRRSVAVVPLTAGGQPPDLSGIHDDIDKLQDRLDDMQAEMANIGGDSPDVISYQSLGFRNPDEANAWIEEHCPHGKYGLIIDFHIMMEHVEQKIKDVDALARLEKVHKIKLPSNSEAVAIASFQIMIPRFFCRQGDHQVIDSTESYFTNIKSFTEWNNAASGFKFKLKKQMERFRKHQLATIRAKLDPSSKMFAIATSSVSDTIAWTYELINYIDVTYAEYSEGKFGAKKSWHITTKLATALIMEVSKPRESTFDQLQSDGDSSDFNARVVFYNTLRSLDVMSEISSVNFADHPAVSTELVKLLSLNTAIEAVDQLVSKKSTLETSVCQMQKDVGGAVRTITTVGNKHDTLSAQVKELTKRVNKLANSGGSP